MTAFSAEETARFGRLANRHHHGLATGLAVLALTGCGPSLEAAVNGKLSFRGNPVAGAQVVFQFKGKGPVGYAITDDEGKYRLSTGGNASVIPGIYRVAISSPDVKLPEPYGSVVTSPLEFDVKSGNNEIEIALE